MLTLDFIITTELSLWFLPLCISLGLGCAYWLYKNDHRFSESKKWVIPTLFMLRSFLISVLAFLLLSPFVKMTFTKKDKPIVLFVQDNSSSILLNKDSSYYKNEYLKEVEKLISKLSANYEVKKFNFGETLSENQQTDFSEKTTNISAAFEEIESRFYNQNIGAVILATDGIYNQGNNPLFQKSSIPYSVYTVLLGDTTVRRDIILKEVNHNKITFLKNQFPVEIFAQIQKAKGQKTTLNIIHNNNTVFSKDYTINTDNFSISETILLEAKNIGTQHYKVQFTTIENEISTINNSKDIYIDVLDGRQNILILANAPHPDIKALKLSIENNENYKVTVNYQNDFDGNINPYSLIIIHQNTQNQTLLNKISNSNIPMWFIVGSQSSERDFNNLSLGVSITNSRNQFNEILPKINQQFPLFTISENTTQIIQRFPPLIGFFGNYQINTSGYQLLQQKIGNVETETPLLFFMQNGQKKHAVLFGEGIWKWRMHDYVINKNHEATNELINKTVQFLAVKEDKSKFRITHNNTWFENEDIHINAELYNDSYELINEPDVKISINDDKNKSYNFTFNKTSQAYFVNAGSLPAGSYQYFAHTNLNGKQYQQKGKFQILPLQLETNNTVADAQLLQNIATKYNGTFVLPQHLNKIAQSIETNENIATILYEEQDFKEWIFLKWIFFILLSLLSIEWFVRKHNGGY